MGGSTTRSRIWNAEAGFLVTGLASALPVTQYLAMAAFYPPLSVPLQATRFGARPTWGAAAALNWPDLAPYLLRTFIAVGGKRP